MSIKYGLIFNNNAHRVLPASCFLPRVQSLNKCSNVKVYIDSIISLYQSQNSPPDYPRHSFQKLADDCIEMAETSQYFYPSRSYQKHENENFYLWRSKDFCIASIQLASESRSRILSSSFFSLVFSMISLRFGSIKFIRNVDQLKLDM